MSKSIYIPYFYIIQHINSGKYYAGVKYAENANPDQLLKFNGYQTSSSIVKQIILEEGLESFIIKKIKIFDTGEEALDYESRFLKRVNAAFNDSFLNRSNNSISTLNIDWEKLKKTNLSRYGFESSNQSEEVKEKKKQNNLEKYGFEYTSQVPEIKEKKKQTCLENHGVSHPMQSEEVKEKSKQTNLERYGVEHVMQSPETKEKYKQTIIERHGVEYISQSEKVKEKYKQTIFKKYGVVNLSQSDEIKEKKKQTNLKNFGVENPMQSELLREKHQQTCLENYGCTNPSQSLEVQEKKRKNRIALHNRPVVIEIRKYRDKFKLKLGNRWFWKPQEILDNMLEELKITYGEYC